jgi:alpha-soluble NSF attachment protein
VEECDIEVFTDAVAEYDSVSKLDKWKTTLLLRIKNAMKESDLT